MDKMVHSWARFYGGNSDALKRILKACDSDSKWLGVLMPSVFFQALEVIEESEHGFTLVMISVMNPFDALMDLPLTSDVSVTMGWDKGLGVRNRIQGIVKVELTDDEIASIDPDTDQYDVIVMNMLNAKMDQVW
jgi:hypothetical protein